MRDNADREGVLWSLGCLPYLAHDDRHDESEWDENDGDLALGHGEHADVEMALASEAAAEAGEEAHDQETAGGEAASAMPNRSNSGAASSSGDADAAGAAEAAAGEDQSMRWKELAARSEARLAAAQQSPDAAQDGVDSPGPDADSLPQPYAQRPTRYPRARTPPTAHTVACDVSSPNTLTRRIRATPAPRPLHLLLSRASLSPSDEDASENDDDLLVVPVPVKRTSTQPSSSEPGHSVQFHNVV